MNAKELENKAEKALHFLHQEAGTHAIARAQADHMAEFVKLEKARIAGMCVGMSQAASESEALRHPDYQNALENLKTARVIWYEANFKREAADAIIGAWQTCCANERRSV